MDHEIFRNIKTFLQLLNTCKGDAVSQWDDDALKRAFHWAKYTEKLYSKVVNRPGFLQKLNSGLERIQKEPGTFVMKDGLTAENLKDSRKILTKILLENSHLPSELYHHLLLSVQLKTVPTDPCRGALGEQEFVEFAGKCTKLKSTYKILNDISSEFDCQENQNIADHSYDVIIDAHLLRDFLLHQLSQRASNPERNTESMDSLLHSVAAKSHGLEVIGSMLGLEQPVRERYGAASLQICEEFVFHWLMKNKNQYIPNS